MRWKRPTALAIVVLAGVIAAQAALGAAGGNALGAKLCQKNGWQALQTSSGGTFGSPGECASYAAVAGVQAAIRKRLCGGPSICSF